MPLDLLVVSVARRGDGWSIIGFTGGGFKRLVAPTPAGALRPPNYRIDDVLLPRPWDRIRVEAPWPDSRPSQPENLIVDHTPWQLLERPAPRPCLEALERHPLHSGPLFGTPHRSMRANGPMPGVSILYVEPASVLAACIWDAKRERYNTRLRFTVDGYSYDLPLTDLHYSTRLRRGGEGDFPLEHLGCRADHGLRLIVTLGEPLDGWCYKLVSGILPRRTVRLMGNAASTSLSHAVRNAADGPLEDPRSFVVGA